MQRNFLTLLESSGVCYSHSLFERRYFKGSQSFVSCQECFKEAKAIAGIKRMQCIEPSPTKGKVLCRLYSSQPEKSNHCNNYNY